MESTDGLSGMHSHSLTDGMLHCTVCSGTFRPRVPWQLYCSDACRTAHHKKRHEPSKQGIRGHVHDMRPLKGGKWSVIVHLDPIEAAAIVKLSKGQLVGLVE